MSITQNDKEYVANTYARFPVELVSGKGSLIKDSQGKEYIDLGSGIAVNIFGIADDEWQKAVTKQLSALQHTSNLYYSEPCSTLAKMLCERTGFKKVFFSNSGAEANECALKTARRYAYNKYGDESRSGIITLKNSFHGRTIATLKATGQDGYHTHFGPFPDGFYYAQANDIQSVKSVAQENGCIAVMMELIQGEGGVCGLDKSFVKDVCAFAQENDMLVIIDEVQTGNGRTGRLYSYMHFGIMPDIVTTAKGLGGGLPIGATMLGEKVADVLVPGSHGSTFGGNPVCCAGACSILERIDDALLNDVNKKSKFIFDSFSGAKGVKSVTGMGLMIGIESERPAKEVAAECLSKGVLVLTAKSKVRLLPALNIPMDELKKAADILKSVLAG